MEYITVERNIKDYSSIVERKMFEEEVNIRIKEGYIPQGGISAVYNGNAIFLFQSMIKLDKNEESFVSKSDIIWENE